MREELVRLGERIRRQRRRKGWTQTELGQRIGYSLNGIAKIEQGNSDPKYTSLVKIADALGVDMLALIDAPQLLPGPMIPDEEHVIAFIRGMEQVIADFQAELRE